MRAYAALTLGTCLSALGCMPEYSFVDDTTNSSTIADSTTAETTVEDTADTAPVETGCTSDDACAGNLAAPLCNTVTGRCVECLTDEKCLAGTWCNSSGDCVPGCRNDSECATETSGDAGPDTSGGDSSLAILTCDQTIHRCRGCMKDAECPAGFVCASDGTCSPGCTPDHACATGSECCGSVCINTQTSVANCGGCGLACPSPAHTTGMKCVAGLCQVATCEPNWGSCNIAAGADSDGCETDLLTSNNNCGACGKVCTIANGTGSCASGTCRVVTCNPGWGDCDGNPTNGCEQQLNTTTHCGACNTGCAVANGIGTCSSGTCAVAACNAGYGDCDGAAANGCEVNLSSNSANCAACGAACPSTLGTPACVSGVCKYATCGAGLGDCTGSGTCTTMIHDDVNNCGACGRTCSVANGLPSCVGTTCGIASCTTGFADCNSSYIDGCEQPLNTTNNCGGCGVSCSYPNASGDCSTGTCTFASCNTGWGNCDGIAGNGCEKPVSADINNCGACGKVCTTTNGTAGCSAGACVVTSCNPGYLNCDSNPGDCERLIAAPAVNTCSTAQQVLDSSSSPNICGTKSPEVVTVTTSATKFYKVHLVRCDGGPCKDADMMRAKFTLTNPAGVVYELRVFSDGACSSPIGTSASGIPGGTETVVFSDTTWTSTSCYTSKDLWVEVRYKSGANCTPASLAITGGY